MAKKVGRPKLEEQEAKTSYIKIRCHADEKRKVEELAKNYGLTVTDYVLKKCLGQKVVANKIDFLKQLDSVGLELSRAGNNINQLAKHANRLNKIGKTDESLVAKLNLNLEYYTNKQRELRQTLRRIIREMSKV